MWLGAVGGGALWEHKEGAAWRHGQRGAAYGRGQRGGAAELSHLSQGVGAVDGLLLELLGAAGGGRGGLCLQCCHRGLESGYLGRQRRCIGGAANGRGGWVGGRE